MAAETEIQKLARQSLQAKNAQLADMVNESTDIAAKAIRERDEMQREQEKRLLAYKDTLKALGKGRQIGVDLGGGLTAVVSTELINWGLRAASDWSNGGWWTRNSDFMQSIPHIAIGTLLYIAEMATRPSPEKKLPSKWRQGFSEASKIFATAGWLNLARAVRYRMSNSRTIAQDNEALRAENAALRAAAANANQGNGQGNGQRGGSGAG